MTVMLEVNNAFYKILPMKYGAILVKYTCTSYLLKTNMKMGEVKTHIYFFGLLSQMIF
jgi:hypothetical protein